MNRQQVHEFSASTTMLEGSEHQETLTHSRARRMSSRASGREERWGECFVLCEMSAASAQQLQEACEAAKVLA